MMKVRVRAGLLDEMKRHMRLSTDSQLAVFLDESVAGVEKLRAGEPVSWATAMRIAALRGHDYDARSIVVPLVA